jgi:protein-S-isoprenylcysteine O-methyltransferase Ste14/NAD-dependent dihydropyrimidine dehydrogenase PreA subunit
VYFLPIDPKFQKNRKKVGKEESVTIWGPVDPPQTLGIRGSNVAVDWDLCTGCGVCLKVCPVQMYEWRATPNHPTSDKKPFPAKASKCMCCYRCEKQCSAEAIRVTFGGPQSILDLVIGLMMPAQFIAGPIYGAVFGPYFGVMIPFYVGWIVLVLGFLFFLSPFLYFKTKGKPTEDKSLMDTTVIVESGTYGIVRHPQFLGGVLMMIASILISQHWLAAIIGVPFIVWICTKWVQEAEDNLIQKFGEDYRRYMEKVPRLNFLLGIIRLFRRAR